MHQGCEGMVMEWQRDRVPMEQIKNSFSNFEGMPCKHNQPNNEQRGAN